MTRLLWGGSGERFYETGIDRGVLYPLFGAGVAWNGLTAVSENPNGGGPKSYYIDGYKYINVAAAEEYSATLEAFSSPAAFAECDGTAEALNGLYLTQQPRKSFGLSYRTRIGNDVDGLDHGYKIHLVYNALAAPSGTTFGTMNDSPEPINFSWEITTRPPILTGYRPTAHFIIDSRETPIQLLSQFEGILYGTSTTEPRLPSVQELMEVFASLAYIGVFYKSPDGSYQRTLEPIIMTDTVPNVDSGQQTYWLNTSAGEYSTISLVTGD